MERLAFIAWAVLAVALSPFWARRGPWQGAASAIVLAGLAAVTSFAILLIPTTPTVRTHATERPSATGIPALSPSARSASAEPTPTAAPVLIRHEVTVESGEYRLFTVDADGNLTGSRVATFSQVSTAPVDRVVARNGLLHWRTVVGQLGGLSYIAGESGPFRIHEVYLAADGELVYREIPADVP